MKKVQQAVTNQRLLSTTQVLLRKQGVSDTAISQIFEKYECEEVYQAITTTNRHKYSKILEDIRVATHN